jgi:hypothetical protein
MEILKGRIPEGASVTADAEEDQIVFRNLFSRKGAKLAKKKNKT